MNKRIGWIDITKGIAIILVVLGHSLIGLKINDFIFSFHMPIFFIASGLLFKKRSVKETIQKNAKRLLIPYAITSVVAVITRVISAWVQNWTVPQMKNLAINTAIGALFGYGVDEGRKWFFEVWKIGAIWFILAFFWSNIILQVVYKYTEKWQEWQRAVLITCISSIGYIVGQYLWLPTNIDIGAFAIIFMYVGILMRKVDVMAKGSIPIPCWIMIVFIWVYASMAGGVNMVLRYIPGWLSIPGALCGSMLVMKLSVNLENTGALQNVLEWYGRNSMKILCVHLIDILIMPWDYMVSVFGCGEVVNMILIFIFRMILITILTLLINAGTGLLGKRRTATVK